MEVTSAVSRSCHRSAHRIAPWSKSLTCLSHRFRREIVEVIQLVPQERLSDRMAEQIVKLFAAFQGNDIPERVVEQIVHQA